GVGGGAVDAQDLVVVRGDQRFRKSQQPLVVSLRHGGRILNQRARFPIESRGVSIRKILLLDLALLSLLILASRLALVLHEFAGHGLVALAFGAGGLRADLSLFGGGWISYDFPPGRHPSAAADALIAAGGILVNF